MPNETNDQAKPQAPGDFIARDVAAHNARQTSRPNALQPTRSEAGPRDAPRYPKSGSPLNAYIPSPKS